VWTDVAKSPGSPKVMMKAQSFKGPVGSVQTIKGIPKPIDHGDDSDHEAHHDTGDEFAAFMNDAMVYAPYMLAVYGWKLFLIMNRGSPLRSVRKIVVHRNKLGTGSIKGDNCFGCYQGAMAATIGSETIDVVQASFVCVAGENVPYMVAVDHSKKKVLLMVRGTHSLGDLFTDVILKPKELKEAGERWGFQGEGHYAHGGFLAVAMTIRQELERTGVLHKLLGVTKPDQSSERPANAEGITTAGVVEVENSKLPSVSAYQLVLVGHSMGAGIAACVGLMLRPAFPELFCMAYSMPGTVLSYELAEECATWIRSVWVGKDFVARGSYRALEELRERMYDVLVRCKVNKSTVLRSIFTNASADRLLYTPEEAPDTPESRKLDQARARLKQRAMDSYFSKHPLYTPGKMLHLVKVETESTEHCTGLPCFKRAKRRFVPTWVHDRSVVKDLQISSRMLLDHFPDYVADTVEKVAEEYCYFSPAADKMLMKLTSPSTTAALKNGHKQTANPQFAPVEEGEHVVGLHVL
jgi:sn1-specific diacylglycerol lipase